MRSKGGAPCERQGRNVGRRRPLPGWPLPRILLRLDGKAFERTRCGADRRAGDVRIDRRCGQTSVTEQELNGAQVGAGLEQVGRETVA